MNERELLEMAAKALGGLANPGQEIDWQPESGGAWIFGNGQGWMWKPLTDDGDCARMEAALGIDVEWAEDGVIASNKDKRAGFLFEDHNNDRNAARRMASLRVAAEIGIAKGGA